MKEKVIFDTNFLLEKKLKNFFGKKDQLIKFSKVADIIIPDMVVQELLEWYKRNFEKEKEQFLKMALPNVLSHNTDSIKIDETLNQLLDLETGLFQVIDLKNPKYIFDMKQLALKKVYFLSFALESNRLQNKILHLCLILYRAAIFHCNINGFLYKIH